jgi:predicted nucleic acid-binding protein
MLSARRPLLVPEIADFEVRRNLLLHKNARSLARLDILKADLIYTPITTAHMLKAAELWADSRLKGQPTADPKELDCDVILAAMALDSGAIVATENVGHLARYVTALHWQQIAP